MHLINSHLDTGGKRFSLQFELKEGKSRKISETANRRNYSEKLE